MINVKTQFYRANIETEKKISDIDHVIARYIKALKQENCDEAIRYDNRTEIKYHLSSEIKSSISWFLPKRNVAILGAGSKFETDCVM